MIHDAINVPLSCDSIGQRSNREALLDTFHIYITKNFWRNFSWSTSHETAALEKAAPVESSLF